MDAMSGPPTYESFFGLVERPFSLTPDPKYFFKSRAHGRAIETLTFGLRRRERFLLVTGDLGVGKTVLCRTLVEQFRRRGLVSLISNPLMTPDQFLRLLLEDFGAVAPDDARLDGAATYELHELLLNFLGELQTTHEGSVIVIDEAHTLPAAVVDHLLQLARVEHHRERVVQFVLVGQPTAGEHGALGIGVLDEHVSTKARLLPLGRDECADYVLHRLTIAGGAAAASFTPRAIDTLYGLSGGVPRLVNLLCERALQEAAAANAHRIESPAVEAAASALQLLRSRPRRFRWFSRRVS
jgi:general secretion pathway protein A